MSSTVAAMATDVPNLAQWVVENCFTDWRSAVLEAGNAIQGRQQLVRKHNFVAFWLRTQVSELVSVVLSPSGQGLRTVIARGERAKIGDTQAKMTYAMHACADRSVSG